MKENLPILKWVQIALMTFSLLGVGALEVLSQSKPVKGIVKGDDGVGLPGVTVVEKGSSSNGTVTDAEGSFTISVREGATLVVSFIGMKTVEVAVGNQTSHEVVMESDITQLSEVVVIGYGTTKRADLTGSVVSVVGDDLKKVPVASVAESLTGRLAGVQVTSSEGSPDAEINIRVRGGTSISQNNAPLYIVDGFPVNSINDISPSDIQSIDVLKDASSTAIFGSRGANGVIIITTKGGVEGKVSVSFNTFTGFKQIANTLDVLSPTDFTKWQYEYAVLANDIPSYEQYFGTWQDRDLFSGYSGINWQKQIFGRTGTVNSNDLSVRGGADKFNYSFNYARFDDKAIMLGSDFARNNATLSLKSKPTDKVNLGFTIRYSDSEINGGGANEQRELSQSQDARLRHSVGYSPIPIPGLTSDDPDEQLSDYLINPFIALADNDREQLRRNFNMVGSFDWKIIENLQFRTEFGLDNNTSTENRFYGRSTFYVRNNVQTNYQGKPAVVINDRRDLRLRNANTLSYDFKNFVNSNHRIKALLGHEMIKFESTEFSTAVQGFENFYTARTAFRLISQGVPQSVNSNYLPDDKLLSFFGRINYDFMDRYILSATYRADGSSKFLGNNRWGYFPSVAAAWKVSEESFMAGTTDWLNSLKLRVSYGEAGNNNIPVGQTKQNFISGTAGSLTWINNVTNFWAPARDMANPNLLWETTVTRNVGLDFGLFKGRLNGAVETYMNTTNDLLIRFPVPGSGYDFQYRNMGQTENKGIEASINYIAIDKANYGLSFSANISFNRNEILSLGLLENFTENTGWASTAFTQDFLVSRGQPVGMMYGYVNAGRYEVSDFNYDPATQTYSLKAGVVNSSVALNGPVRPGSMKLADVSGADGTPDGIVNQFDQQIIGNANPKHTGGFVINAYAYGFDLTSAFSWSYGNDIYNANKIEFTSATVTPNGQYRNLLTIMGDGNRWTDIDAITGTRVTDPDELAALNANTTMWSPYMSRYVFSDWAIEDGSFLRLNTLTLGYSLPKDYAKKIKLNSLRFYTTAYNVFVLTNYSGLDPEVSTRRRTPLTPGVDYSPYPRNKQIVFGLNLTF
jgi:TonB-linked SusC/RagA family outer membrane protein